MANYDRRLLVPYLQDVCSSEMLCAKLERDIQAKNNEINQIKRFINQRIDDPCTPAVYEPEYSGVVVSLLLFVIAPVAIALLFILRMGSEAMPGFFVAVLIALFFGTPLFGEMSKEKQRADKMTTDAYKAYKRRIEENKLLRTQISAKANALSFKQRELQELHNHLIKARNLRHEVYSVNIIPSRYRNVHVAYYLYDFFYSSRETDLEKTIQTMLLDEIIQRLDQIIVQNEAILLNQRMQLAMQENQNRMMAENNRKELQAIARLEQNQQLQLDYQNMINANQMVTNFFLAADYIERHR